MATLTRLLEEGQFDLVQEYFDDVCSKYCKEMDENRELKQQLSLLQRKYDQLLDNIETQRLINNWDSYNHIMNK